MDKKKGFGGQWVDVLTAGTHTDDKGIKRVIDARFLEQLVSNLDADLHEPPVVIGHPETDAPAFGWVCGMRVEDGILQAQFCDVDPQFEEMVRGGKFKKRSVALYLDKVNAPGGRAPALRHVGFLGAKPPAVKGLRNISFDEGEAATFEVITFSEGEAMGEKDNDKEAQGLAERAWDALKKKLGLSDDKPAGTQASFSEADVQRLIGEAVEGVEAKFSETLTRLEKDNKELRTRVDRQSGASRRSEIVTFCEGLGGGKFLPAFKRMGMVEFMESLAASGQKVSVVTFAEEGGGEVQKTQELSPLDWFKSFLETLPSFVEFGEKFGSLRVTGRAEEITDPDAMEKMRAGMGIKKSEGGTK